MPKGKGTYGSKVGRPPKKAAKGEGKKVDKYFLGGAINALKGKGIFGSGVLGLFGGGKKGGERGGDPFSTRNPEGLPAEEVAEAMELQNIVSGGTPTTNAQDRSQASPDTTEYNEGGKV